MGQLCVLSLSMALTACASKILDYKNVRKLEENVEYENLIQVEEIPGQEPMVEEAPQAGESADEKSSSAPAEKKDSTPKKTISKNVKKKPAKKKPTVKLQPVKEKKAAKKAKATEKRQPEHEDAVGFEGRRPKKDPFRVGEVVRLSVTYFGMTAGYMDLKVKPFVEVNGEKSYSFEVDIKSSDFFSRIYTVDDKAWSYMDYETLLPYNLSIKVRESKQIKEVRSVFNHNELEASYWEKKVKKDGKEKEKKVKWDIEAYSQNVVTALYYLRTFTLTPGKNLQFRVADDGKNYMFTGKVIRKEKLKTEIGTLDTVVVKPRITVDGVFKQVGEIYFWLTDDDRKFPVRIESEIKIGTLKAKVQSIKK